ncbi:MAG: efflux RND transporter periplasmic adaptor subunit [Candidatus Zixiibacteriota bacterium]
MTKGRKRLLIGAIVVVVGIVIIWNLSTSGKKTTSVNLEEVYVKDITEKVSASGYIQPKTKVNITSEVNAEIKAVLAKEGDTVKKGAPLVLLDTLQLQKDVDQARFSYDETMARTEANKSLYQQAEEEYARQKELFAKELISETAFNNAEYSYLSSKYSYEAMVNSAKQAQARYEKQLDLLSKTRIAAPMDGVVTYLDAEVGEIAAPQTVYSQGKILMVISNLSAFEVEVDVDETEIVKVEKGQMADIEVDAFPDTTFKGEVIEIGNTAIITGAGSTEQSTNFKVKVLFSEAHADIKPGMSATVDIITNIRDDILAVPYGAIVMRSLDADSLAKAKNGDTTEIAAVNTTESGGAIAAETGDSVTAEGDKPKKKEKNIKEVKGVFIEKDGQAKFVEVATGIADQKDIEITSGLSKGDMVITGPYRTLRIIKEGELVESTGEQGGERN